MAFRERFKDKMDVVGKNGEGAMLVEAETNSKPPAKAPTKTPTKKAPVGKQPTKASMGSNRTSVPIGGMPPPQMGAAPMPAPFGGMPPASGPVSTPQHQPRTTSPGRGNTSTPQLAPHGPGVGVVQPLGMMPGGGQPPMPLPGKTLGKAPPMPGGKKITPLIGGGSTSPPPPAMGGIGMPPTGGGIGMPPPMAGMPSSSTKGNPLPKKGSKAIAPIPSGVVPTGDDSTTENRKYNYQKAAEGTKRPATNQSAKAPFGRRANSQPPQPARPATEPKEPTYTPYSLDDYRKMKDKPIKRGGLGPSDTDEQRFYRIMRKKANEFGTASNRVNMAVIAAEGQRNDLPIEQPMAKDVVEKNERRLKALEYSRNVPKPKVREESTSLSPTGPSGGPRGALPGRGEDDPMLHGVGQHGDGQGNLFPKDANAEMLMELEEKHRRDQEMIEAIKKQLKM